MGFFKEDLGECSPLELMLRTPSRLGSLVIEDEEEEVLVEWDPSQRRTATTKQQEDDEAIHTEHIPK